MGQNQVFWHIKNSLSNEQGSERSEQSEQASEASSPEQANKWAVRANERTAERVAKYLRLDSCLFETTVQCSTFAQKRLSQINQNGNYLMHQQCAPFPRALSEGVGRIIGIELKYKNTHAERLCCNLRTNQESALADYWAVIIGQLVLVHLQAI